jgi:hypothetical protein
MRMLSFANIRAKQIGWLVATAVVLGGQGSAASVVIPEGPDMRIVAVRLSVAPDTPVLQARPEIPASGGWSALGLSQPAAILEERPRSERSERRRSRRETDGRSDTARPGPSGTR